MGNLEKMVDSPVGMEGFRAKYRIPPEVGLEYCSLEEILIKRRTRQVVIPVIAFVEEGMTILMGRITRDYLRGHRLAPHQCVANMFRILGCVEVLNNQMNLGLTWHDVVHLYELHNLGDSYYLKSRSDEVRLISCLPKSNKGLKDDFLIVSGQWHDGIHCPVRAGKPGGTP